MMMMMRERERERAREVGERENRGGPHLNRSKRIGYKLRSQFFMSAQLAPTPHVSKEKVGPAVDDGVRA